MVYFQWLDRFATTTGSTTAAGRSTGRSVTSCKAPKSSSLPKEAIMTIWWDYFFQYNCDQSEQMKEKKSPFHIFCNVETLKIKLAGLVFLLGTNAFEDLNTNPSQKNSPIPILLGDAIRGLFRVVSQPPHPNPPTRSGPWKRSQPVFGRRVESDERSALGRKDSSTASKFSSQRSGKTSQDSGDQRSVRNFLPERQRK